MKKKLLLCLLIMLSIFVFTGCDKKEEIIPKSNNQETKKESIVGYYSAFETVQYGKKYTGNAVKSENITLLIRDDNTATLKWGDSAGKDYKIDGDKFIALAGDEEGKITYKNGIVKIELSDGDYISFKK